MSVWLEHQFRLLQDAVKDLQVRVRFLEAHTVVAVVPDKEEPVGDIFKAISEMEEDEARERKQAGNAEAAAQKARDRVLTISNELNQINAQLFELDRKKKKLEDELDSLIKR